MSSRRILGASFAALVAIAIAGGACGDDSSGSGGGGAGEGSSDAAAGTTATAKASTGAGLAGCGDFANVFATAACSECAEEACCDELFACTKGTPCDELWTCVSACADAPCVAGCEADFDGEEELLAVDSCVAASCKEACAEATVGVCGTNLVVGGAGGEACTACVEDACCDEVATCEADPACSPCVTGEGTCDTGGPFTEVLSCFGQSCGDVCDG